MILTPHRQIAGFSRPDLLTTVATLMLLGFLVAPAIVYARGSKNAVSCLANLRQLQSGWQNYANDHGGLLLAGRETSKVAALGREAWVKQTNELESDLTILNRSPIRPYLESNRAFHCPGIPLRTTRSRTPQKFRSYSMSHVFDDGSFLPDTLYRTYARLEEIAAPSQTFVLIDEHPDSLNDGSFVNEMVQRVISSPRVIDFPGNQHDGAAGISFADGSAQIHRWRGKTLREARIVLFPVLNRPNDAGADMLWLSQHTTVRR